jgi:hypothetical protein
MNNVIKRLITIFISLFLLAYVGYQAYLGFYHPIRTVKAQSSTATDSIPANAFVVHNETLISADVGTGVIDYTRANGERVPLGGAVANVYASAQDAENQSSLQEIKNKIAQLQDSGTYEESTAADLNVLSGDIDDKILSLAQAASASDINSLDDTSNALLAMLNKKQLATGTVRDFSAQIAALQKQETALAAKTTGSVKAVTSPISGCFVSNVDGYEGMVDISKILDISASDIVKLESAKPAVKSGAVGKIVSEYEWYITCVISNDNALKLKVGNQISAQFLLSSESAVPVNVAAINKSADGCAVVLECDYMTSRLAVMRNQSINIITRQVTGIKLSNDVIHIVNGQKGVYVLEGNTVNFKNIEPAYTGNGYTMSEIDSTDSKRLQVYDSVIEDGDDLYDGKIVN